MKWNWMCRAVCGLLSACLMLGMLTVGQAAPLCVSIGELREEVADGWHQTYESHGRTIIIDLNNIGIPEVDSVPVLTVCSTDPVPQDRFGELSCLYNDVGAANFATSTYLNSGDGFMNPKKMQTRMDRVYSADNVGLDYHAAGNSSSVGDVIEIVRSNVERWYGPIIADGMTLASVSIGTKVMYYNSKTNEYGDVVDHPDNHGSYIVEMYQAFHGIPVLYFNGGYFGTLKDEKYGLGSRVFGYMGTAESYAINNTLVQEEGVKREDVPLLSFADIKPVFEQLIMDGRLRNIEYLQLGYVLYIDPTDKKINWAVPTWVARAEFYDNASDEAYEESWTEGGEVVRIPKKTLVFVQAQTGAFADPLSESKSRRDVSKIMTLNGVR